MTTSTNTPLTLHDVEEVFEELPWFPDDFDGLDRFALKQVLLAPWHGGRFQPVKLRPTGRYVDRKTGLPGMAVTTSSFGHLIFRPVK